MVLCFVSMASHEYKYSQEIASYYKTTQRQPIVRVINRSAQTYLTLYEL